TTQRRSDERAARSVVAAIVRRPRPPRPLPANAGSSSLRDRPRTLAGVAAPRLLPAHPRRARRRDAHASEAVGTRPGADARATAARYAEIAVANPRPGATFAHVARLPAHVPARCPRPGCHRCRAARRARQSGAGRARLGTPHAVRPVARGRPERPHPERAQAARPAQPRPLALRPGRSAEARLGVRALPGQQLP